MHIPSKAFEKAILDYILDSDNALDKNRFTLEFDRVSFLKRENNFDQSSTEQIRKTAEILNSFSKVKIIIGYYKDNQGVAEDNLKLSELRSESTRAAIQKLGVSGNIILTEGFGPEISIK